MLPYMKSLKEQFGPALLASFAERNLTEENAPALAEQQEFEDWLAAGCPDVDGMSAEDREVLLARPLTVPQTALREHVSERTVYRWLSSGELAGHRAGREWRITQTALDARRVESAKPKPRPEKPKPRRRRSRRVEQSKGASWLS